MHYTSSTHDRHLYRRPRRHSPTNINLCSCEPAMGCPEGVMVRSGLRGVLTPLYTRMQNGWCCQ
jgi:hypothetical protein